MSEETTAARAKARPSDSNSPAASVFTPSVWRVWIPSFVLLLCSFGCLYVVLTGVANEAIGPLIVAAAMLVCASMLLLAFGGLKDGEARALYAFPAAVEQASKGSLELRREYNRALTAVEGLQRAVESEIEQVRAVGAGVTHSSYAEQDQRFIDELTARKSAESATEDWQDRVVELVRSVERLLDTEGLKPEYTVTAERTLADVERLFGPLQFAIVRPAAGDSFDPLVHQVAAAEQRDDYGPGVVLSCDEWGFVVGDRRIPAIVTVSA